MALDQFGAEIFLELVQRMGLKGKSLLTLGRQHLAISPREFSQIPGGSKAPEGARNAVIRGETFADEVFSALGFAAVSSLDASDYEECSLVHDLNEPIPESWHGNYDVVFDGGTLEHVFHFPNAVSNAMNLVRPGGLLIMQSPSNNMNGHGFFQFSPELFFRLFSEANGFRVACFALFESHRGPQRYSVVDPAELGTRVSFGGSGPLQSIMAAERITTDALPLTFPYQSDYASTWGGKTSTTSVSIPVRKSRIKRHVRRFLPDRILYRYDLAQWNRKNKRRRKSGISKVASLNECFMDPNRLS
ncbi:MAG: hypothetical protein P1U85_17695 [Verrucomicrobiales bacterium]|nr:hypothetical protein [Verrucomicrobiales bacterium]